jgi:hypothetical protein
MQYGEVHFGLPVQWMFLTAANIATANGTPGMPGLPASARTELGRPITININTVL